MDRFDWLEIEEERLQPYASDSQFRVRPTDGPSFYQSARGMREAGHFRAAAKFYAQAIAYDQHHYSARVEWIDTLVRARQFDAAEEASQEAVEAFPTVRMLWASRALVAAHTNHKADAVRHSDASLRDAPPSWYACCVRAEVIMRRRASGRAEALSWLEKGADAAKQPWEAFFIGGWMLLDAQLPALAAGYFAEAVRVNPRAPLGWLCLGDCFREAKLYDQALFYYQRVTELESSHELALERQKNCLPKLYGLMRVFNRSSLQERWKNEFNKALERLERNSNDF